MSETREAKITRLERDVLDAAIEWQTYWAENASDREGRSQRQGYLYDRVRRLVAAKGEVSPHA